MNFQSDINGRMRAILIDWLIEVHMKFKLVPETLYLCVNIIDRYCETKTVPRAKLQVRRQRGRERDDARTLYFCSKFSVKPVDPVSTSTLLSPPPISNSLSLRSSAPRYALTQILRMLVLYRLVNLCRV